MSLTLRPATRADIDHWYPETTCSFRAWVAELDGEPVGIAGISLTRPIATLFSTFDERLRPHLRRLTLLRGLHMLASLCRAQRLPVAAFSEPDEPASPALLTRMGFAPVGQNNLWVLQR